MGIIDLKVKNIIENNAPSGNGEETVYEVLKLMIKNKKSCFIVLSDKNRIEGFLTLYDILDKIIPYFIKIDNLLNFISTNTFLSKEKIQKVSSLKVKEIMTKKVYCLNEEDDIVKAIVLMYVKNFDYIPVIDKNNNYQGLITKSKVEKTLIELIQSF